MADERLAGEPARRRKGRLRRGGARTAEGHGAAVAVETLQDQAHSAHEEARMVLPGIQALFGFQLIAVFNRPFFDLDEGDRLLHLAALLLVASAVALIMAPASYRRLSETARISRAWIRFASRCIASAMVALTFAIGIDIYLVAVMISKSATFAAAIAVAAACAFAWLWFGLPLVRGRRDGRGEA